MDATSTGPAPRATRRSRRGRTARLATALVGLALIGTACGSGGSHAAGVAHVGKGTSTTAGSGTATAHPQGDGPGPNYQRAVEFSQCMRKNGEPGFPDPNKQGDFLFNAKSGVDPESPAFAAAEKACKALAPPAPNAGQSSTFMAQALKFSQCMRANGEKNFPDPSKKGGTVAMTIGSGVDPNSPPFQKAMSACHSLLPQGGAGAP